MLKLGMPGAIPPFPSASTCSEKGRLCPYFYSHKCEGNGKTIPLQAWTGPEGFRRLRLPDFKTIGT